MHFLCQQFSIRSPDFGGISLLNKLETKEATNWRNSKDPVKMAPPNCGFLVVVQLVLSYLHLIFASSSKATCGSAILSSAGAGGIVLSLRMPDLSPIPVTKVITNNVFTLIILCIIFEIHMQSQEYYSAETLLCNCYATVVQSTVRRVRNTRVCKLAIRRWASCEINFSVLSPSHLDTDFVCFPGEEISILRLNLLCKRLFRRPCSQRLSQRSGAGRRRKSVLSHTKSLTSRH